MVVSGCWLILWKRGAEEKLLLSHLLKFASNEKHLGISGEVQEKTRVRLEHGNLGKLLPTSNNFREPFQGTTFHTQLINSVSPWNRRIVALNPDCSNVCVLGVGNGTVGKATLETTFGRRRADDRSNSGRVDVHDPPAPILPLS